MAKKRQHRQGRSSADARRVVVAPSPGKANRDVSAPVNTGPPGNAIRSARSPASPADWRGLATRRTVVAVVAAVVVVLLVAGGIYLLTRKSTPATAQVADQELLGVPVPDEGRNHVPEGSAIVYRHNPPASGPHYPSPYNWGIYTTTVAPGYWVHNLEHGGIVVLYDCPAGCSQIVDELRQAYSTFPKDKYNEVKLVATPYSGLPNGVQVMAVAWDYQKAYTSFDLQKLLVFYNGHVDRGPEDIP